MPNGETRDKTVELLEKILAVQLHSLRVRQGGIAKVVGKSKTWVNQLLKNVPAPTSKEAR